MVPHGAGVDIAVTAEWEKVPVQALAAGQERAPHPFLNRECRDPIIGAVQDYGRATNLFRRLPWGDRPHGRRGFVAHGRIVTDERAHLRRCGNEGNGDAPAPAAAAPGAY